jgi:tRNA(Arg) A34 adenosine deaminase TadA
VTSDESAISDPERNALELAWDALMLGSLPVGAVVTDAAGRVVARGRNRVYESVAPAPEIAGTRLAHAEVNALTRLGPQRRYEDHHLVVTLEPCPLCTGALAMSTVGRLTYLGADPYAGATSVVGPTPYTSRLPVGISGPRPDRYGRLAAGLHVAFYLRRDPSSAVVSVHRELRPDLAAAGESLVLAGVFDLAERGLPWSEVSDDLLALV